MTREELAEIKEWIESEEKWEILGPDWEQLVRNLLAEVERLQGEVRAAAGCVGEVFKRQGLYKEVKEVCEVYSPYGNEPWRRPPVEE